MELGGGVHDLKPDWPAQVNRCIVPCLNAVTYEWLRKGPVTTLGELFKHVGKNHTAKAIYAFYRTRRLVVVKRKKNRCGRKTGMTGSSLQPSMIRSEYTQELKQTHGDALVEEYIQVKALSAAYVKGKSKQICYKRR